MIFQRLRIVFGNNFTLEMKRKEVSPAICRLILVVKMLTFFIITIISLRYSASSRKCVAKITALPLRRRSIRSQISLRALLSTPLQGSSKITTLGDPKRKNIRIRRIKELLGGKKNFSTKISLYGVKFSVRNSLSME